MKRPIEKKDQEPIARLIRSVFEEYGAPLVNTVYDDLLRQPIPQVYSVHIL